jgi:AraC-like DNA-binding protein
MVFVLDGKGVHVTETRQVRIHRGGVFIISGRQGHAYRHTEKLQLINLLIDNTFLRGLPPSMRSLTTFERIFHVSGAGQQPFAFHTLEPKEFHQCLQLVEAMEGELRDQMDGYRDAVEAILRQLIVTVCRLAKGRHLHTRLTRRLAEVIQFIGEHYRETVTIGQLAAMASMSNSTFMRNFRKATGTSPMRYLLHLRIAHACRLIRESSHSIKEIALQCGFHDSNYFARQFRQLIGMSAKEHLKAGLRVRLKSNAITWK